MSFLPYILRGRVACGVCECERERERERSSRVSLVPLSQSRYVIT
jgi:hypothetical protein